MKHSYLSLTLMLLMAVLTSCASTQPPQTRKAITSISFSPNQKLLAFANANEIRVVEADSNRRVQTLRELPQDSEGADPQLFRLGVGDSMLFLDNDRIASSGMGGLVTIWDVRDGRRLASVEPLPGGEFASTIDYYPANKRLVIGTSQGQVLLTTLEDNRFEPLVPLAKLDGYVWDLQLSRDGRYLASAAWHSSSNQNSESTDEPADAFARGMDDSPASEQGGEPAEDFARVMSTKMAGLSNVVIWDLDQKEMVGELKGATGVLKMGLVPGERALLTAGENIQVWEFLTQEQYGEIRDPSMVMQGIGLGAMVAVSVAGMGAVGAGFMAPSELLLSGFPLIPTTAFIQHACVRVAAISPDGQTIVSTTPGPTHNVMAVIDRKENKVVEKWTADSAVCDLQFSMDGKQLVAATSKGVVSYDTTSWKKTKRY